jgi:uncharacterized protein (DUF58 family)
MRPRLSRSGQFCLLTAGALVSVGVLRTLWPLVMLGTLLVVGLGVAWVAFAPVAALLRSRQLEMAWWVPPSSDAPSGTEVGPGGAVIAGRPFPLRLLLRNHSPRMLGDASLSLVASPALSLLSPLATRVPCSAELHLLTEVMAHAAGNWFLHGAALRLTDRFDLFAIDAYFANPLGIRVFPRLAGVRAAPPFTRRAAALDERVGLHRIRFRGLGGELREIRDHAHGDPFKQIAWKATARTGKLKVRELERELIVTYQLVLDVSSSMRGGEHGHAKLDYGIEICAALARAAADSGDRTGLCTFDARIVRHLRPGDGRAHERRVLEHLMELRQLSDEDLTDCTDGELCAHVARYLRYQEGLDVRLAEPPTLDDPRWSEVATGPLGELYDLEALDRIVGVHLRLTRETRGLEPPRVHAESPAMARLRQFCRLRGLELPYRRGPGRKRRGLTSALLRVAQSRGSQIILLVSDLKGLGDDLSDFLRAVRLTCSRHRLLVVMPFAPLFVGIPDHPHARRVAAILTHAEHRAIESHERALERLGVPVLLAGPQDSASQLLRRWQQHRTVAPGAWAGVATG